MAAVKICGLKTVDDVKKVNKYLPEYIGFVFAKTKRFVTDEQAFWMKQALDGRIRAVGVFVDEPIDHIISLCSRNIIDAVQLHGSESDEYIRELRQKTKAVIIKAAKVQSVEGVLKLISEEANYMLFDTYRRGTPGGTGERFEPDILRKALEKAADEKKNVKPYFIAGGLNCENVGKILENTCCYGVDVSTGVETDGIKDEIKIKKFIEKCRRQI